MNAAWVGIIGTLAGVVIGWFGNLASQKLAYDREANERLASKRRETYLAWLAEVHGMYEAVALIHRQNEKAALAPSEGSEKLRQIPSTSGQTALEHLRLMASDHLAESAAAVWRHMRRQQVPIGQDMNPEHWRQWRDSYWELRRAFLNAARIETGLAPLDWQVAGVTVGRPDER